MKVQRELKKGKIASTTTDNKTYKQAAMYFDPYWDEGVTFYPMKKNRWAKSSGKLLMKYQMRMYKSWKHNRKTQWKQKI